MTFRCDGILAYAPPGTKTYRVVDFRFVLHEVDFHGLTANFLD